ncbi:MAG: class I SAM-dependent methyltransferase [Alphaproteobacteria bacterium]|nr:cyclopropane-fatty-acyl-phospholipid synthase family protein [Alphaproteobacteria bacterium]MDE2335775.1 class I SAM-dependent methyltransferase [Alphaproteobacteria bacterium]
MLRALEAVRYGDLAVFLPDGEKLFYGGQKPGSSAEWRVNDMLALDMIAASGETGLGEAYMTGLWDTPDITALLRLFAENADALRSCAQGGALYRCLYACGNGFRRNNKSGSRKNVQAHYDLGNAFYSLWLDDSMTYSGALFGGDPSKTLEQAQRDKYRRILDRLAPRPGAHILEIGCGWGGFMAEAVRNGQRVTGVTLSPAQAGLAQSRLAEMRAHDAADVCLRDYRDVSGQYDHVVSIGMMEHVGEKYWPEYMHRVRAALKPGGKAMIQTIVARDDLFHDHGKNNDFVRKHIFPGGMLPSAPRFTIEAAGAGLRVNDIFRFGGDYAITLEKWLERFENRLFGIMSLGYDETFIRKWRFYLAGCAAMFRAGRIDVMQAELEAA